MKKQPHEFPVPPTATVAAHQSAVAPMVAGHAKHKPAIAAAQARIPLPVAGPPSAGPISAPPGLGYNIVQKIPSGK